MKFIPYTWKLLEKRMHSQTFGELRKKSGMFATVLSLADGVRFVFCAPPQPIPTAATAAIKTTFFKIAFFIVQPSLLKGIIRNH